MDFSGADMTWCPPWYVSWSVLAMLLFPLLLIPVLRNRNAWLTPAPVLLVLLPLFHSTTLAFLVFRSDLLGMAIAGLDAPAALAAGLADAYRILGCGAACSGIALVVAWLMAMRRARGNAEAAVSMAGGRGGAAIVVAIGVASIVALPLISFLMTHIAGAARLRLYPWIVGAAFVSGAVTLATIVMASWLMKRPPAQVGRGTYRSGLAIALLIVAAAGAGAWLMHEWLWRIAMYGGFSSAFVALTRPMPSAKVFSRRQAAKDL
jgi:hypothetical protein